MRSFDVDGIALDFIKHAFEWDGRVMPKQTIWGDPLIWELYYKVENVPEFWETIPALIQPEDINVEFDYYLTSIPDHLVEARRKNLLNLGFPDKPIIASYNKLESCQEYGITHHVDDKMSTVLELNAGGVLCIKYVPYYLKVENDTIWDIYDIKELKERWND